MDAPLSSGTAGSNRSLVELVTDAGRDNHVELPSSPAFHLQRTDASRVGVPKFRVERVKVIDADTEARVLRPNSFCVLDEVEFDVPPPDPGHAPGLPDDDEAELLGV